MAKKFQYFDGKESGRKEPKKGTGNPAKKNELLENLTPKIGDRVKLKDGRYATLTGNFKGINGYIGEISGKKALIYRTDIIKVIQKK